MELKITILFVSIVALVGIVGVVTLDTPTTGLTTIDLPEEVKSPSELNNPQPELTNISNIQNQTDPYLTS